MPRKKSAAKKAKEAAKKEVSAQEQLVAATKSQPSQDRIGAGKESHSFESEDDEDDISSEEEDDYGELVTEEVEDGIKEVLTAIKNNDKKLFDPSVRFFEDPEKAAAKIAKTSKEKPVYLKDYHRMNILSGETFKDDEDEAMATVDGKQSFASQQKEEKAQILGEIKSQFKSVDGEEENDDEEEDDFLIKKAPSKAQKVSDVALPDPAVDDEKFLEQFVSKHAWVPKEGDKVLNLDGPGAEEDEEEFEDAVEQFENAYNFRYEDPNAAEIVSYARNQATLRRSGSNTRRRKREEEKEAKNSEKREKETAIQKKKTEKVNKLTDVLEQIRKEYGADINEEMVQKITGALLNGDFKDDQWDAVVSELFNEEYYNQEAKPTWDEDDEIMGDFYREEGQNEEKQGESRDSDIDEEPVKKKSRKEHKKEKLSKKKDKKKVAELVENAIESNKLALVDEVEEERKSRSRERNEDGVKFRYREVSPESFGLTHREIFEAADTDLNEFIGLKKFAPYRAKELRAKDRRKVTKSKRVREWKKKVFGKEEGLQNTPFTEDSGSSKKSTKKTKSKPDQHS